MSKPPVNLVRGVAFPTSSSRAVVTPLQPSVVYASPSPDALDDQYEGRAKGYTYAREGHPNADVLAQKIDQLEGVSGGIITSSGMSAITAGLLGLLSAGDHVIAGDQLYGRSLRMLKLDLPRFGITTSFVDPTDAAALAAAVTPQTKVMLLEVVSNPTLRVADMQAAQDICAKHNLILMVDNTFTTPKAYCPCDHGADVVIHSVTKLLAGHSDATLGYIAAVDPDHMRRIYDTSVTMGFTPSPFDCWLAERGLYSFDLRYDRCQSTASDMAEALARHPKVSRVLYPTRSDHPDHNRAVTLLGGQGSHIVSFELDASGVANPRDLSNAFVQAADAIAFAPTLGDIGTTLSHPASSSHRALSVQERAELGMTETFFRMSVGIEAPDVLIAQVIAAIDAATNP
ncbi:trans-sulfuration enzyme family protein [Algirhabdus cladophorae]|uniref:trans-sulfuration enzyme family protein n=1 Tax=Algirhabdus cladophorae TaxID=3377108 RepID=UPI003B846F1F